MNTNPIAGRAAARIILLASVLAACGGEPAQQDVDAATETTPPPAQPASSGTEVATEYAPELGVDLSAMTRTESGLYYQVLEEGSGEPIANGAAVTVEYSGWFPDGQQFDSGSFPLVVGAGQAIRGFDEGVAGMRPGEKRRLVIPPALAYGEMGRPPRIPGNATLVFEVRLPN